MPGAYRRFSLAGRWIVIGARTYAHMPDRKMPQEPGYGPT